MIDMNKQTDRKNSFRPETDYDYDYDYRKCCNRLQSITIVIIIISKPESRSIGNDVNNFHTVLRHTSFAYDHLFLFAF